MDSNGDGNVNQPEDYALLRERYLPADLISLANPPELTKITEATTLKKGISSLRIEVELVGTNITHVYATVIPPTYDPTTELASWSELEFDEFDLGKISEGKYAATYANSTMLRMQMDLLIQYGRSLLLQVRKQPNLNLQEISTATVQRISLIW